MNKIKSKFMTHHPSFLKADEANFTIHFFMSQYLST
jgi:hypothetical protein